MDNLVQVALNITHNNGMFTYRLPHAEPNVIGRRVKVTLKNRPVTGVIIDTCHPDKDHHFKVKDVIKIIDQAPIITKEQHELMLFCAKYYFNALGPSIHLGVPRDEKAPRDLSPKTASIEEYDLSAKQNDAVTAILAKKSGAFLLEGVTGSGKTHVYLSVAKATLLEQKSVLFLVPEISLTPQLVKRVQTALGIKPLVIHSNITQAKKRDTFFALLNQTASVLIGARSAIFAPLHNLGLIVVDEEHDGSLKQDESPRYHARDLALWRAKNEHARVILGSATPSLESIFNAQQGKLTHLVLEQRFKSENQTMPQVSIIDLKERAHDVDFRTQDRNRSEGSKMCILSRPLIDEMKNALNNQTQVLLFLNQRGYAKWGVCHQCGTMVECPHCSVGLTYYQNRRLLLCHQCKHAEEALTICRNCNHDAVRFLGLGTERLEEEVRLIFPDTITLRLDRDVVRSQRRLESTLAAMHERKAHILIGTQMIAKGHDFLHVGLVGIVCADVALSMPDFRAGEKAFQLFTQVAGRAGRGNFIGKAMIQTFNPEHQSIIFAKDHNVRDFVAQELAIRQRFFKPPFSRAAIIRCEHKDEDTAESLVKLAYNDLSSNERLTILGPAPSPIERINNRYRFQLMALAKNTSHLHEALALVVVNKKITLAIAQTKARFIIDVDPHNLS
jgi:primosomal protein N' (replication factor Y)